MKVPQFFQVGPFRRVRPSLPEIDKEKVKPRPQETAPRTDLIIREAEQTKREIILSARDEAINIKDRAEKEAAKIKELALETEKRLIQHEEVLGKKNREMEEKEKTFSQRSVEVERLKQEVMGKLEQLAGMTREEAKQIVLKNAEDKTREEMARLIQSLEVKAKDEAEDKGREILATAMLHGVVDIVPEYTVSTLKVDDEVKGKIIGKEGRNIRAFEQATGVDVELDDEGIIRLSSFDPIRREVAKLALEKLMVDGRIQPVRIEEIVLQTQKQVQRITADEGKKLCHSVGVYNLHPDLMAILGRLKFRFSYGQNMITHTLEETKIGIALAQEIGADVNVVRLGCLLHDVGKVIEEEGNHIQLGVSLLKKYQVPPAVIGCVAEHHEDKPFSSVESMLVYIADAISGSRPGARYEDYDKYVERLETLEKIAKENPAVREAYALQAGRELRVLVESAKIDDTGTVLLARKIKEAIEEEIKEFPGQIKITVIRELRAQETAK